MIDKTLDARGLKCPLPVLLAGKALKALLRGGVLEILATDRGVDADVVDLCDLTGADCWKLSFAEGVHRFPSASGAALTPQASYSLKF